MPEEVKQAKARVRLAMEESLLKEIRYLESVNKLSFPLTGPEMAFWRKELGFK